MLISRRHSGIFALFAVLALVLAPGLAEARPGGNSSSGSRGSKTYSAPPSTQTAPGTARQFDRTETSPSRPSPAVNQPMAPRPATQGGFFSRNPMMAGLMGGLLGAGLFGLLMGGGLFGGMSGLASFFGLLLQILLIGGLVYLVMRLLRRRQEQAVVAGPRTHAFEGGFGGGQNVSSGATGFGVRPIQITPADYQAFERTLIEVNAAWSRQDLEALRYLTTPEMERYFAQDLADLRARGWINVTRDVRLESGDLSEAWADNSQEYATVAMRFTLVDVTTDASGRVVEGHQTERQTVTELWTFTRSGTAPWELSAIQQTG